MPLISSKKSSHDSGRRERITSPVAGSRAHEHLGTLEPIIRGKTY
jgi:hypothetical protein